jgi:hypothetical protein
VAIGTAPLLIRSLRTSLLAVLESDYVTTARAKGIPERRVLLNHALRNGIMPMITVLGINLGFLIGNTVVVEKVFALPGVGALISQRDFRSSRASPCARGMVVFVNRDRLRAPSSIRARFDGCRRSSWSSWSGRRRSPAGARSATAGTARRRSWPAGSSCSRS